MKLKTHLANQLNINKKLIILNKLLDAALIWYTKHQIAASLVVSQVCDGKKNNKFKISGTRYNARISELKQQISILQNKKCEAKDKLSSIWKV